MDSRTLTSNSEIRKEEIQTNPQEQIILSVADIEEPDDETTPMITTSQIIEHLFCPRFTYFIGCLNIPQHEELRHKVIMGRELHEKKQKANVDYIRKRLSCVKKENSVYLASKKLKVRGVVDEVLHLSDGTLSPLDYKYAENNDLIYKTHRVQSTIYALLIMENYGRLVKKGFIVYTRSGSKIKEIIYNQNDFKIAKEKINEIFNIIMKGKYPKKSRWKNRCVDCCYKNICV